MYQFDRSHLGRCRSQSPAGLQPSPANEPRQEGFHLMRDREKSRRVGGKPGRASETQRKQEQ